MEDDVNPFENVGKSQFFEIGRLPQKIIQPKIIKIKTKIKTMVVAPLRVT